MRLACATRRSAARCSAASRTFCCGRARAHLRPALPPHTATYPQECPLRRLRRLCPSASPAERASLPTRFAGRRGEARTRRRPLPSPQVNPGEVKVLRGKGLPQHIYQEGSRQARRSRETAERSPRDGRETAERQPGDRRDLPGGVARGKQPLLCLSHLGEISAISRRCLARPTRTTQGCGSRLREPSSTSPSTRRSTSTPRRAGAPQTHTLPRPSPLSISPRTPLTPLSLPPPPFRSPHTASVRSGCFSFFPGSWCLRRDRARAAPTRWHRRARLSSLGAGIRVLVSKPALERTRVPPYSTAFRGIRCLG